MIHLHSSIRGVHGGVEGDLHHHSQGDKAKKGRMVDHDTDRTWAQSCTPACEAAIVASHPYAAKAASGVPLTPDETTRKADLESTSNVEVGKLMQALAQIAKDKITEGV